MNKIIIFVSFLLGFSIILTDSTVLFLSLGDLCLLLIMVLICVETFFKKDLRISYNSLIIWLMIFIYVLSNTFFSIYFNDNLILSESVLAGIKFFIYSFSILLIYNYFKNKNVEYDLIAIIVKLGIASSILGYYIFLGIISKGIVPYEFLWMFTRKDMDSYTYIIKGFEVIRLRSIFSEPAHFGVFLNLILAIGFFNKAGYKIPKLVSIFFSLTILLSFSFAAIIILLVIYTLKYFRPTMFKLNLKSILVILLVFPLTLISIWKPLKTTFFDRFVNVINGKDGSANVRLIETWSHISQENILLGNGIGNTPAITNNYAYMISDLGLMALLIFICVTIYILFADWRIGVIFILINFAKGGYLTVSFWSVFLVLIVVVSNSQIKNSNKIKDLKYRLKI